VFSPDGKHVAFNFFGGPGGDEMSLGTMDFDASSKTFSNLKKVFTPPYGKVYWPSFLPTNDAVIFEVETHYNGNDYAGTRMGPDGGARAELWWADLKTGTGSRLDTLNGRGYMPTGPNNHMEEETLTYEPTVNPIVSGGYAWVILTTRRLYGNVATADPWTSAGTQDVPPKKLWVSAIDLNAPPGTDPSHPAFYLPAQELRAANARGFWVVDPCQANGSTCESGDECCGGFCKDVNGGYVCSDQVTCGREFDKCTVDQDCCAAATGTLCIGGHCSTPPPK
jgi:hypothetical protein